MTDYISREALLKMIGTMPSSPITDREERLIRAFISTVKNFPAADVRPVVWISVEEALPKEFVSVQAHMTDAGPFPSVREAYLAGGKWFFPALNEYHPVDKWTPFSKMPLPEPPKEET